MMNFASAVGRPFGTQMGKWLFFAGSYVCVIGATVLGRLVGLIFVIIRLETFKMKKPVNNKSEEDQKNKSTNRKYHALSPRHIIDSFKTACKKRENGKRFYMWVYLL